MPSSDTLSTEERAEKLLERMTLSEKIRQMSCMISAPGIDEPDLRDGIGGIVSLSYSGAFESANALQIRVIEESRLGIPALVHAEGICGALGSEMVSFPAPIGLGATFDTELVRNEADRIRMQLLSTGVRQVLAPVLDLARDLRWGRVNECFGSDPTHVSAMGAAFVHGLQGNSPYEAVAATAKHFLGHSICEGGLNIARSQTDPLDLRENFAKPFEAAIQAGLSAVMASYSEVNGKPVCASREVLTGILRESMGFEGVAVSDYMSLEVLSEVFRIAQSPAQSGVLALTAGLDMELPRPFGFSSGLREAVKRGEIEEILIDKAVKRILCLKLRLGLFEKPYVDAPSLDKTLDSEISLKAAEESLVLLKNDGILPILNRNSKIAVIGPTGNSSRFFHGTYSLCASIEMALETSRTVDSKAADIEKIGVKMIPEDKKSYGKSLFESIKELFPNAVFVAGCDITGEDKSGFKEALKATQDADIALLAVGGKNGWASSCTSGEGIDSANIGLSGVQEALVLEVAKVCSKTIVVHTDGRPLVSKKVYDHTSAVIEAWLPGPFGGIAIAKVIAGIVNPSGRLPLDIPKDTGQTPLYFSSHRPARGSFRRGLHPGGYMDTQGAQYPFGFGLSYSSFSYSNVRLESAGNNPVIEISVDIENTSPNEGTEIVQVYGRDEMASIVRPNLQLVGFARLRLMPGEKRTVKFSFWLDQFAFPTESGWVLEKGDFTFFVSSDSSTPKFKFSFSQKETLLIEPRKRGFFASHGIEGG
ncbi:MAG: glycoside hydrolase family 3 C-terminal domain-containing protein [Clostridiales bacterium]|nr:glycoside hydrolase family 3 C-terminal domain-containing protein [Clostridiales bacterium]